MLKKIVGLCLITLLAIPHTIFALEPSTDAYESKMVAATVNRLKNIDPGFRVLVTDKLRSIPLFSWDGTEKTGMLYTMQDGDSPYFISSSEGEILQFSLSQSAYFDYLDHWLTASGLIRKDIEYLAYGGPGHYAVKLRGQSSPIEFLDVAPLGKKEIKTSSDFQALNWTRSTDKSQSRKVLDVVHVQRPEGNSQAMSCGPIAGAGVVKFWSKWHPQLIGNKNVLDVARELYYLMETNRLTSMTSLYNLKKGLERYFRKYGHPVHAFEVDLSYQEIRKWIQKDYPLIALVSGNLLNTFDDNLRKKALQWNNKLQAHFVVVTGYDDYDQVVFYNIGWAGFSENLGTSFKTGVFKNLINVESV